MQKLILIILSVLFVCVSCQKEISTENGSSSNIITQPMDTLRLKMLVGLDTNQVASQDTVYRIQFFYDNLNRVRQYIIVDYYSPTERHTSEITDFYYNGSDSLPIRRVSVYPTDSPGYPTFYDTTYYTYSIGLSNRLVSDSVCSSQSTSPSIYYFVESYTYLPQGIQVLRKEYLNGVLQSQEVNNISQTVLNGNVTSQRDTISGAIRNYSVIYDDKPNPLRKLISIEPYFTFPNYYYLNGSVNNIVEMQASESYFGLAEDSYQMRYRYNLTGYPIEAIVIDTFSSNGINKLKYIYE